MADAVVEHRYSHSAGRASALKAYFVERNRLFVAVKNFPVPMLVKAILVSVARYSWHLVYMLQGRGKAAEFADGGRRTEARMVRRPRALALHLRHCQRCFKSGELCNRRRGSMRPNLHRYSGVTGSRPGRWLRIDPRSGTEPTVDPGALLQ